MKGTKFKFIQIEVNFHFKKNVTLLLKTFLESFAFKNLMRKTYQLKEKTMP